MSDAFDVGMELLGERKYADAKLDFDDALAEGHDRVACLKRRGECEFQLNDDNSAMATVRELYKGTDQPSQGEGHYLESAILKRQGNADESNRHLQLAESCGHVTAQHIIESRKRKK